MLLTSMLRLRSRHHWSITVSILATSGSIVDVYTFSYSPMTRCKWKVRVNKAYIIDDIIKILSCKIHLPIYIYLLIKLCNTMTCCHPIYLQREYCQWVLDMGGRDSPRDHVLQWREQLPDQRQKALRFDSEQTYLSIQ